MPISKIGTIGQIDPSLGKASPTTVVDGSSFADSLGKALESFEEKNREANTAVTGMLNGTVDVHEAMIALHEAEESLEIKLAIRNKFVQAYQEIMRMGL